LNALSKLRGPVFTQGFAVVAEKVRNLAARSANAPKKRPA
jgi:hypothetical protein